MKRDYLGDSYDAVKRLWQQILAEWAPLYADPRFVPEDLRGDFNRLTGIPMLCDPPSSPYSILNDPDTGIRLPNGRNQSQSRKHIALPTICAQLRLGGARCVITFDQSTHRVGEYKPDQQRQSKVRYLTDNGLFAFYYVSHAPFLFTFSNEKPQQELRQRLASFGIPGTRLETYL